MELDPADLSTFDRGGEVDAVTRGADAVVGHRRGKRVGEVHLIAFVYPVEEPGCPRQAEGVPSDVGHLEATPSVDPAALGDVRVVGRDRFR